MSARRVWSYLDFKEKVNKLTYNNSNPKVKQYPLVEILNLWILTGKMKCFASPQFGAPANLPLSPAEFTKLCITRDTVEERLLDENGEEKFITEVRADTIGSAKITGFLVVEDWLFNRHSVMMEKKIVGLAPVIYDAKTHKNRELYWVYYPECCELLYSYTTINPNGVKDQSYTYREAFEKRFFSAYVVKEGNVYDREKPENAKGFEVKNENRRNREKFESAEDDLWSK